MSDAEDSRNDAGARPRGRVALFVTCLVDLYRPQVGSAAVQLLEGAGYVVVGPLQGGGGQPKFNSGERDGARKSAARVRVPSAKQSAACFAMPRTSGGNTKC